MRNEDNDFAIKVVVVGNGAVGKSSMIQRYCKGIYTNDYKKTIGVDFLERSINIGSQEVRLMLWDTAGQEEFDAITKAYYRGAQACVLAFSLVDRDSFQAVKLWKGKVEDEVGPIPMVLVENKMDLVDQAVVTDDLAQELSRELNLRLFQTSVKSDSNVEHVFQYLAQLYMTDLSLPPSSAAPKLTAGVNITVNRNTISLHPSRQRTNSKKVPLFKCFIA